MSRCTMCLHNLPIFDGLPIEEFRDVCLHSSKNTLKKGEYLFHRGQYEDTIYLIKQGTVKLVQFSEDGKEIVLDITGRGQVIGETALFKHQTYFYDGIAMETVHVCSFSLEQFEFLIKTKPNLALNIISNLGQQLYSTMKHQGNNAKHTVENKLLALLFRLAEEYGIQSPDGQLIQLSLTQEIMSNMIGSSRVMVAQVLKQFKNQGIILKKGKYYIINDQCLMTHFEEENSYTISR